MKKILGIICIGLGFGMVFLMISSVMGFWDTIFTFLFGGLIATVLVGGVYLITE